MQVCIGTQAVVWATKATAPKAVKFEAAWAAEAGAREAGMDGALGKPCRPEALRDALRRVNQGTFNSWKASSKRGTLHF